MGNALWWLAPSAWASPVLLAMAMQFRRYRGSRIFAFDMGRSIRAAILGMGGEHYDLGADDEIAFHSRWLASTARGYRRASEWNLEGACC